MRPSLRFPGFTIEILDRRESLMEFRDVESAASFLSQFKDKDQLGVMRDLVLTHAAGGELEDSEVLNSLAGLLVSGKVRLLKTQIPRSVAASGEVTAQKKKLPVGATAAPAKKSWIEIDLFDPQGKPIGGARYRLRLPDGSVEEGKLDACGHAEYYDINPGNCELTFPDFDAKEWEPVHKES